MSEASYPSILAQTSRTDGPAESAAPHIERMEGAVAAAIALGALIARIAR